MKRIILSLYLAMASLSAFAEEMSEVGLISGWRMADGNHVAGVEIKLAPGWKTYWRSPGDAGIPPQIDFSGSKNLKSASLEFPVPVAFDINGMRSIGYKKDVILPLVLTPIDPGQPITLEAEVVLGVCNQICVPVDVRLSGLLQPSQTKDARLSAALGNRPRLLSGGGGTKAKCEISGTKSGISLAATLTMPAASGEEIGIVEIFDRDIWVGETAVTRRGQALTLTAEMEHISGKPFALDRSQLRFTVLGKGEAVEVRGCD